MTDYIYKKGWWLRNRIWILGSCVFIISLIIVAGIILEKPIGDFTKAMTDSSVYDNAFGKAKENNEVIALLGELEPIHFLELLEGEVRYEDNDQKIMMSARIKGSIKNGTMDIIALKQNAIWEYQTIRIRTKKPKKVIEVLDQTK